MTNYIKPIARTNAIINRFTEIYFKEAFKDLDLCGSGQIRTIMTLAKYEEGVSQEELAQSLSVDKATISRMIQPLILKKFITRTRHPEDKRAYILQLSKKARKRIPEIREKAYAWEKIISRNLSAQDIGILFNYLQIVEKNAHDYIKGENIEEK